MHMTVLLLIGAVLVAILLDSYVGISQILKPKTATA
jgi:hypothetical protein